MCGFGAHAGGGGGGGGGGASVVCACALPSVYAVVVLHVLACVCVANLCAVHDSGGGENVRGRRLTLL